MVKGIHKQQISIGLITGIILAIFIFIGTFAGNFLWEVLKLQEEFIGIGWVILTIFFVLAAGIMHIAIKNLTDPSSTDYHKLSKFLKFLFTPSSQHPKHKTPPQQSL